MGRYRTPSIGGISWAQYRDNTRDVSLKRETGSSEAQALMSCPGVLSRYSKQLPSALYKASIFLDPARPAWSRLALRRYKMVPDESVPQMEVHLTGLPLAEAA